jgi:hypothetical protein
MQWDVPADQPGRQKATHLLGATSVAWMELTADNG